MQGKTRLAEEPHWFFIDVAIYCRSFIGIEKYGIEKYEKNCLGKNSDEHKNKIDI